MGLVGNGRCCCEVCLNHRFALISHGPPPTTTTTTTTTEKNDEGVNINEPTFNYGNAACLSALGCTWEELCALPARRVLSVGKSGEGEAKAKAEPDGEDVGADVIGSELMDRCDEGYVQGVDGIWVNHNGIPFRAHNMLVWTVFDDNGKYYGQAALFDMKNTEAEPV